MSKEELVRYLIYCNERDFDVHVHIVGDGAFRQCCDMHRPAELGITINYTLRWSGGNYGEKAKLYLGEERWNRFYTFSPMIKSGALIVLSSDLIAYSKMHFSNPFVGMQISHTRVDMVTPPDPERFPGSVRPPVSEKFDREFMLKGYTIDSAKQMRWDDIMGSLEVGKKLHMYASENLSTYHEYTLLSCSDASVYFCVCVK